MKKQTKPVPVDAIQLLEGNLEEVVEFFGNNPKLNSLIYSMDHVFRGIDVTTPNGVMRASVNDWLVVDADGNIIPHSQQVFDALYEDVPTPPEVP